MNLNLIAKNVILNRIRRGFPSATNLSKTTLGLVEELGEFEKARKTNDTVEMIDALVDMMIYCLGGMGILNADTEKELYKVLIKNETRTHTGHH